MDNVSEVLALRIVDAAGLEPPFDPGAKMALVGRSASFNGKPTHLLTHSVRRVVRPQGRGMKVPIEDAGKNEGFTVTVEIGVPNFPQHESVLTSYASVSDRQRRGKP